MKRNLALVGLSLVLFLGAVAFQEVSQMLVYATGEPNPYDKLTEAQATYANIIAMREMFGIDCKHEVNLEDLEFLDMIFSARQLASLWDAIQRDGPITTWVRLANLRYWGPSSRVKLALFYQLQDEQASINGYPVIWLFTNSSFPKR